MSIIRRKYTQEFKDSAVKLIAEQGYQLSEASHNLGVNIRVLHYAGGEMQQITQQKVSQLR